MSETWSYLEGESDVSWDAFDGPREGEGRASEGGSIGQADDGRGGMAGAGMLDVLRVMVGKSAPPPKQQQPSRSAPPPRPGHRARRGTGAGGSGSGVDDRVSDGGMRHSHVTISPEPPLCMPFIPVEGGGGPGGPAGGSMAYEGGSVVVGGAAHPMYPPDPLVPVQPEQAQQAWAPAPTEPVEGLEGGHGDRSQSEAEQGREEGREGGTGTGTSGGEEVEPLEDGELDNAFLMLNTALAHGPRPKVGGMRRRGMFVFMHAAADSPASGNEHRLRVPTSTHPPPSAPPQVRRRALPGEPTSPLTFRESTATVLKLGARLGKVLGASTRKGSRLNEAAAAALADTEGGSGVDVGGARPRPVSGPGPRHSPPRGPVAQRHVSAGTPGPTGRSAEVVTHFVDR